MSEMDQRMDGGEGGIKDGLCLGLHVWEPLWNRFEKMNCDKSMCDWGRWKIRKYLERGAWGQRKGPGNLEGEEQMAGKENNKRLIVGCLWDYAMQMWHPMVLEDHWPLPGPLSEKEVDKHCIGTVLQWDTSYKDNHREFQQTCTGILTLPLT